MNELNHNSPVISVVVPVYNAEKYLRRCLESIKSQSFTDFEIILIDDGSPDDSGAICDEYAEIDSRFKVIHQSNGGVSVARQTGLDAANGEYVIHADPDDWVETDWLQLMIEKVLLDDADIALCDFDRLYSNKKVEHYYENPFRNQGKDIEEQLLSGELWGGCINKLVRRELFINNNIRFIPSMTMWEDLYVSCRLFMLHPKVTYVPRVLYHYDSCVNSESLCTILQPSHIKSAILFIDTLEPCLSSEKYRNSWFYKKSVVKGWIFRQKAATYDLKKTYKEINNRYIQEAKKCAIWSDEYCISLCLRGYPMLGNLIFKWKKRVKKCLKPVLLFRSIT